MPFMGMAFTFPAHFPDYLPRPWPPKAPLPKPPFPRSVVRVMAPPRFGACELVKDGLLPEFRPALFGLL
jgi:hypothetical protein